MRLPIGTRYPRHAYCIALAPTTRMGIAWVKQYVFPFIDFRKMWWFLHNTLWLLNVSLNFILVLICCRCSSFVGAPLIAHVYTSIVHESMIHFPSFWILHYPIVYWCFKIDQSKASMQFTPLPFVQVLTSLARQKMSRSIIHENNWSKRYMIQMHRGVFIIFFCKAISCLFSWTITHFHLSFQNMPRVVGNQSTEFVAFEGHLFVF